MAARPLRASIGEDRTKKFLEGLRDNAGTQVYQKSSQIVEAVAKAVRSEHAKDKDASKTADDGLPLHSFRTLLKDLGTLAYNVTHTQVSPTTKIVTTTRPTPLQAKAFALLCLNPACTQ